MAEITRETLELAALAAGVELVQCPKGAHPAANLLAMPEWAPHLDDGDAFRLILRLDLWLVVSQRYQSVSVRQNMDERDGHKGTEAFCVEHDGTKADTERAAREAVVLCAAAVGERMQEGGAGRALNMWDEEMSRATEAAVLSTNGLEVRRG